MKHKQTQIQLNHHSFAQNPNHFYAKMHKPSALREKTIQKVHTEPQEICNFKWVLSIYILKQQLKLVLFSSPNYKNIYASYRHYKI